MQNQVGKAILAVALSLVLYGCATDVGRRLDDKLAAESAVPSANELQRQAADRILTAPGLSDAQRARLAALRDSTRAQLDSLQQTSLKLRSILVQDVVSPAYDFDEVQLIKGRLREIEEKRLDVTFDAVEEANRMLGHLFSLFSNPSRSSG